MLALVNWLRQDKNILSAEDQAAYIELLIKNIDYRIAGEYFPRIRKIAASTILYILWNQVFSDDSLMDKVNQLAQTGRCTSDEA
jgi:hypothetical protein